ncbi:RdRp [Hubei virga-like virus 17]|uniref:RdRp n=1 Tax=Hubei virga-like virus 17 TaxID=1923332 RepID=UPI00090CC7EE|nr:RdRp [Hubei virga-like virus 17]APG77660.1 RdRp [Hubei virga-like virus 17]
MAEFDKEKFSVPFNDCYHLNPFKNSVLKFLGLSDEHKESLIITELAKPDSILRTTIIEEIVNDIKFEKTSESGKQKVHIPYILNYDLQQALQGSYPAFNLLFTSQCTNPHGFAAASRLCEERYLLDKLGYVVNTSKHVDRDDLICDIGGNYWKHLTAGRRGVHSCCPILSVQDDKRHAERISNMAMFLKTQDKLTNNQSVMIRSIMDNENVVYCINKAQDCNRTALAGMMLHSSYDVKLVDLADIMVKKKMLVVHGSFIFDAKMLDDSKDAGVIEPLGVHYEFKNNRQKIQFSFVGDSSFNYSHEVSVYFSYLFCSSFCDSRKTSVFYLELGENINGIQFFKVVQSVSLNVPRSKIFHKVWFNFKDKMVLEYFDLDYGKLAVRDKCLVRRFMVLDKDFWDRGCEYALTNTEEKFKPAHIYNFLVSYNRRITVGGKEIVSRSNRMEPADLYDLANAIYLKCYVLKFDKGKILQILKNNIIHDRDLAVSGLWGKLFYSGRKCIGNTGSSMFAWLHKILYNMGKTSSDLEFVIREHIKCVDMETYVGGCFEKFSMALATHRIPGYTYEFEDVNEGFRSLVASVISQVYGVKLNLIKPAARDDHVYKHKPECDLNKFCFKRFWYSLMKDVLAYDDGLPDYYGFEHVASSVADAAAGDVDDADEVFDVDIYVDGVDTDTSCVRMGIGEACDALEMGSMVATSVEHKSDSDAAGKEVKEIVTSVSVKDRVEIKREVSDEVECVIDETVETDTENTTDEKVDKIISDNVSDRASPALTADSFVTCDSREEDQLSVILDRVRCRAMDATVGDGLTCVFDDGLNMAVNKVPGDGMCMFYALAKGNLKRSVAMRAAMSEYVSRFSGETCDNVKTMLRDGWGDSDIFRLYVSMGMGAVCVHLYDRKTGMVSGIRYSGLSGESEVVHILLADNHCDYLSECDCVDFVPGSEITTGIPLDFAGKNISEVKLIDREAKSKILSKCLEAMKLEKTESVLRALQSPSEKVLVDVSVTCNNHADCKVNGLVKLLDAYYTKFGDGFEISLVLDLGFVSAELLELICSKFFEITYVDLMSMVSSNLVAVTLSDFALKRDVNHNVVKRLESILAYRKLVGRGSVKPVLFKEPVLKEHIMTDFEKVQESFVVRTVTVYKGDLSTVYYDDHSGNLKVIYADESKSSLVSVRDMFSQMVKAKGLFLGSVSWKVNFAYNFVDEDKLKKEFKKMCGKVTFSSVKVIPKPLSDFAARASKEPVMDPMMYKFDPKMRKDPVDVQDLMYNAAMEQKELWRVKKQVIISKCREDYDVLIKRISLGLHDKVIRNDMGYVSADGMWLWKPVSELGDYQYGFDGEFLVKLTKEKTAKGVVFKNHETRKGFLVTKETRLINDDLLYDVAEKISINGVRFPPIELVLGVPGCGKTTYLLNKHVKGKDMILSSTKEGSLDIKRRLGINQEGDEKGSKLAYMYRTGHSYLMHGKEKCDVLYVDEALMVHPGQIIYCAVKASANKVVCVGDDAQIPYDPRIPTAVTTSEVLKNMSHISEVLSVSHRCPLDVVHYLNATKNYKGVVTTTNYNAITMSVAKISTLADVPKKKGVIYLTFTQNEKIQLANDGYQVNTIHEFQGKQNNEVALVRLNSKNISIYGWSQHILVALTRHTDKFVYYTVTDDDTAKIITASRPACELEKLKTSVQEASKAQIQIKIGKPGGDRVVDDFMKLGKAIETYLEPKFAREFIERQGFLNVMCARPVSVLVEQELGVDYSYSYGGLADVWFLQDFYDYVMPGNSIENTYHDQYMSEISDMHYPEDNIRVDVCTFQRFQPRDYLTPVLRTSVPRPLIPSQQQVMRAYFDRNGNVPDLTALCDDISVAEVAVNMFFKTYTERDYLLRMYSENQVTPNTVLLNEWLRNQPGVVKDLINKDEPIYWKENLRLYNFSLKRLAKPVLEINAINKIASPQTIAAHPKFLNAIFCPMFKEIKKRLLHLLKSRFLIFTDMSIDDFEKHLNKNFNYSVLKNLKMTECDMSKYDKSQGKIHWEIEKGIYKKLGFDEDLLELWEFVHGETFLKNFPQRFTARVEYQRKSGDAATFFGNTIVLMAILATVYDLTDAYGMFAGDDSLLFSDVKFNYGYKELAEMFNLESKLLVFNWPYFCSKFLLNVGGKWKVVPDPLKLVTKLGRFDLVDFEHRKEYKISYGDLSKIFGDASFYEQLSCAVCDRYKVRYRDFSHVFYTLFRLGEDDELFNSLYYLKSGDVLNIQPCRPNLDI